ncbi:alanyl-tRNA editing protein [Chloroflexota bacterium]
MTELLYQIDSYQKDFDAAVVSVDDEYHGVALDRTAFYPGGGGQPPDHGFLTWNDSNFNIKRVINIGGNYIHILDGSDPLPPICETVHAKIDWDHRYQLMRTHTAMHILCGVIWRDYGASVTGGNMEPLKGRMDFEFETMRQELVKDIEATINQEMNAGRNLIVKILPREEAFQIPDLIRTKINLLPDHIKEVRVVEIEGLDLQADGGTHVKNTSEVGKIKVADYKSKGKINKRIYVELESI